MNSAPMHKRQSGMALLIVLWVVAGLSLFAASLGRTVRSEAQQASVSRFLVMGRAWGEAAVNLTLMELKSSQILPSSYAVQRLEWDGVAMEVEIVPADGLVNLDAADAGTLTTLFEKAARLSTADSQQLAQALMEQRAIQQRQGHDWEVAEDVLQVPGMNYFIFQAIRPFVRVQRGGAPSVRLSAAPEPLRTWIKAAGLGQDSGGASNIFRITAKVPLTEEGAVWVERQVQLREDRQQGAPWKVLSAAQHWQASGGEGIQ